MWAACRNAFRTLTIVPLPGEHAGDLAAALYCFPVVGLVVGGLVAAGAWLFGGLLAWPAGAGVAGTILALWITGGLHLDGLGDVADAYAPGRARDRMLAIMKDHHLGAFGVMAIASLLLVKACSLARLAALTQWSWMLLPFILSRTMLVLLMVRLPYARREGGTATAFVHNARPLHFTVAGCCALGACLLVAGGVGGLCFLCAGAMVYGLARWMKQHFGGITGDLLGMANEILEGALLCGLAAGAPYLNLIHEYIF